MNVRFFQILWAGVFENNKLTAIVKLFLKKPNECQALVQTVPSLATQDSDNPVQGSIAYFYDIYEIVLKRVKVETLKFESEHPVKIL